ncbi:ABC transporter permease subunit [Actinomadura violacea]|uniref:ABC transporter permease subunit n=1 Tax=Actinomadura violacea TaxID=2819934 RepID=A0ABS3RJB7_9ACTN|nr:ABC transporter permease subunit [Actinomadura violacea]MBO2456839.1 ABC transporter permease subunit [Actinomadura violacea]
MTTTEAPRPAIRPERESFRPVLRAEWTKFRTIRGRLIGLGIAVVLCTTFTFLVANGTHEGTCTGTGSTCQSGHPYVATGPDGEAVADSYQFVGQPLTGNATITVRVRSLTGVTSANSTDTAPSLAHTRPSLAAWAKAGILLRPSTAQGSPYAAVMATGAHGVRFQYDYTHDQAGRPGTVSVASPRWLRLTRTGDTLTGYDSADGTAWTKIGTAHLAGLPSTVQVGLFVTSPVSFEGSGSGFATQATAAFDHVSQGARGAQGTWREQSIGVQDFYPKLPGGGYHRTGGSFVLRGSGDIAPAVVEGLLGTATPSSSVLTGLIVGLIAIIVVAAMFITVEYRRGMIRTTFAATPRRHRVLAAKAVVVGGVAFVVGTLAAAVAVPIGEHVLKANGAYVFPAGASTMVRIIAGTGALVAVTAIAVLAVGTIVRKSAGAVTAGIVVFVLPYIVGSSMSGGAEQWLFRLTPAAGFSVLGALPRSAQVDYPYTLANGYYPLSWWAGLAVLCAYAALALGVAAVTLRRRDA